jgi:Ser/Thr protein kinase RdoA (MazF antagonist)
MPDSSESLLDDARVAASRFPDWVEPRVSPLRGGLLHASFAVEDSGGKGGTPRAFVLQRISDVFADAIHDNIEAVTTHLAARGMSTLRLQRTEDGGFFADLGPRGRWRALSRVPGATFDRCQSSDQARSAGELIGRFHAALSDFEAPLAYMGMPFHDTPLHFRELRDALARHGRHRLYAEISELAQKIEAAAAAWEDLGPLPARVVHGDLKFNNILFEDRDQATSLIDLDTLSRLPLYFDLGDAWRSWCNCAGENDTEADLDLAIFRASAEGYLGAPDIGLAPAELRSLAVGIERVSLELSARFAADALNESYFAFDASRFESRGEHNWIRARGQLSLHDQALATRDERIRFLLA